MKNTKRTIGPITRALRPMMGGSSSTALDHLALRLRKDESLAHFDLAAIAALEVGLFVLGLHETGDACLGRLTDALYGKDSEASSDVFNSIVAAGDSAHDARINMERAWRRDGYKAAKAEMAGA